MENTHNRDSEPKLEKNYSYFIENPEEITLEDIKRIEAGGEYSFLNNFHRHVYRKDPGIEEAMQAINFDFERFIQLSNEKHKLVNEYYAFLNEHRELTPGEEKRLNEIKELWLSLNNDIEPKLLELYKAMRRSGYNHYPDLTA